MFRCPLCADSISANWHLPGFVAQFPPSRGNFSDIHPKAHFVTSYWDPSPAAKVPAVWSIQLTPP